MAFTTARTSMLGVDPQVSLPGLSYPPTPIAPPSNPLRMSSFLSPKFGAQPTHSPGDCQDFSNNLLQPIPSSSRTPTPSSAGPRKRPASKRGLATIPFPRPPLRPI